MGRVHVTLCSVGLLASFPPLKLRVPMYVCGCLCMSGGSVYTSAWGPWGRVETVPGGRVHGRGLILHRFPPLKLWGCPCMLGVSVCVRGVRVHVSTRGLGGECGRLRRRFPTMFSRSGHLGREYFGVSGPCTCHYLNLSRLRSCPCMSGVYVHIEGGGDCPHATWTWGRVWTHRSQL